MKLEKDHVDRILEDWLRIKPDADLSGYGTLLRLIRLGRLADARIERVLTSKGLGGRGDYEVLSTLRRRHPEPVRPTELARLSLISNSGMTARLDRLEAQSLLQRRQDGDDRRSLSIEITQAGIELVDSVIPVLAETAEEALDGVRLDVSADLRSLLLHIEGAT